MDIKKIRKDIPITQNCTYLNHGTGMVLLQPVVNAIGKFNNEQANFAGTQINEWMGVIDKTREKIAKFIGAKKNEIAYISNTNEGINIVANGIGLRKGDNVILNTLEFPANTLPFVKQQERGVEIKWVKEKEGKILFEDIENAIDEKTKIIALSHVSAENGFKHNLEKIGKLCKEKGIYFSVDAIQSLGAVRVDVKHIDFLSSGCMKWLLAPFGIGIFYCREDLIERLNPVYIRWLGVENPFELKLDSYKLEKSAKRFESSGPNLSGIFGLSAAIGYLSKIGINNIEKRIYSLTDHLVTGLQKLNFNIWTSLEKEHKSGIVTIKTDKADQIKQYLFKNKIIVSSRWNRLRISPHFYNTKEEIDSLLKHLKRFE